MTAHVGLLMLLLVEGVLPVDFTTLTARTAEVHVHIHGGSISGHLAREAHATAVLLMRQTGRVLVGVRDDVVIIVQQHHFLLRIVIDLTAVIVRLLLTVFVQLLELIRVSSAYERALHVEDVALGIHQEVTIVSLNLDSTHNYVVIFHVDR